MSGLGWQDAVAAALVVGALVYLVWRHRRPRPAPPLVTLGRAPRRNPPDEPASPGRTRS